MKSMKMKYLLYTKVSENDIQRSLGLPEYSYFFVYKEFKRIFSSFAEVVSVHCEEEIHRESQLAQSAGEDFIIVFFCPPHVAPEVLPHKAFCVLAWEFDTIPDEPWGDDPRNDWRHVFSQHLGVICLSSDTKSVIKKYMGSDYLVEDIPVPVWDQFKPKNHVSEVNLAKGSMKKVSLTVDGNVIDSREYEITDKEFSVKGDRHSLQVCEWSGDTLSFEFDNEHYDSGYLGGFYKAEEWGSWSRLERPWLFLNRHLSGDFSVRFTARGFGATIGQTMTVTIGEVARSFTLCREPSVHHLHFTGVSKSNFIFFSGIDLTPQVNSPDNRSMALGLQSLEVIDSESTPRNDEVVKCQPVRVDLEGVVYSSVFNPVDARKNWEDIVSAFCFAFRDEGNVTLLLKITHSQLGSFMGRLNFLLQRIGSVKCRVVAVHGFLSAESYQALIDTTDYYVNASSAEGLCLPMMEFMASGVPAITPDHTAMADYVDSESSFILSSSKATTIWPHDPRQLKKATNYRVCWESMVDRYNVSYQCVVSNPSLYKSKAESSMKMIRAISSDAEVMSRTLRFLDVAIS